MRAGTGSGTKGARPDGHGPPTPRRRADGNHEKSLAGGQEPGERAAEPGDEEGGEGGHGILLLEC